MNKIIKKFTVLMAMTLMAGQLYGASEYSTGDAAGSGAPVSRLLAPDPVSCLEKPDLDSEGNRSLGQQVLDIMRGTFIARQEYMRSMDAHRAELLASLPPHITPGILDEQGGTWRSFILQRDKDWEVCEGYVQEVMASNYDRSKLRTLLNYAHQVQLVMNKNRRRLEHACAYLIEKSPSISHIYKNDADIFRYAFSLFLPLMDVYPKYEEHFQDYAIDALPTADGAATIVTGVVFCAPRRVAITTHKGERLEISLPHLNGADMAIDRQGGDKFALVFILTSGFELSLRDLDWEEAESLLLAIQGAFKEDAAAAFYARTRPKREARTIEDAERTRLAAVQAAAKKAAEAEAKAKADAAANALLAELGAELLDGPTKKGGKKKGVQTGSGSAASAAPSATQTVGKKKGGKKKDTKTNTESAAYAAVSAAGSSGGIESIEDLLPTFASSSTAGDIMPLESTAAGGAGGSSLGTCDDEARPSKQRNPAEGKRPEHQTVIPVVGPFGRVDRQHAAPRGGLDPLANITLAVFLGKEVDGAVRPIRSVDWSDTVHLLEKLGFAYDNGNIFKDAKKHRLILDKLHYDENRMNSKAKAILLRQLAAYGFTHDALIRYLG